MLLFCVDVIYYSSIVDCFQSSVKLKFIKNPNNYIKFSLSACPAPRAASRPGGAIRTSEKAESPISGNPALFSLKYQPQPLFRHSEDKAQSSALFSATLAALAAISFSCTSEGACS